MGVTASVAVLVGAGIDALVGEPRSAWHPVAWFGRLVTVLDRDWRYPTLVGIALALGLPLAAAGVVGVAVHLVGQVSAWLAAGLAGLTLALTTSRRMLVAEARRIVETAASDPAAARDRLPALAGRDAGELSPGDLRSAAVESLAENLADGLVAPALAFVVGAFVGLPVAAAAAAWVKGVNTLDSMLGYPDRPIGSASARLDDAVMAVPARVTAVLLALAAGAPGALWTASEWAREPASPNSGWPMATLAATLGVRLRKPGHYDIGAGAPLPDVAAGRQAIARVQIVGLTSYGIAGVAVWF